MDFRKMRSLVVRDGVEGKICSRCGEWKPLEAYSRKLSFVHSQCKACQKAIRDVSPKPDRRYYFAVYRRAHNEKIRAYRKANTKLFRIYARRYQQKNQDRHREANRKWAALHKEQRSLANRLWRERNPEKALQKDHRRRARERLAPGVFTRAEWELLKQNTGNICLCCGLPEGEVKLVPDHIIPLAKGGSNFIDNIQPLCESCNKRKGARTTDYRRYTQDEE